LQFPALLQNFFPETIDAYLGTGFIFSTRVKEMEKLTIGRQGKIAWDIYLKPGGSDFLADLLLAGDSGSGPKPKKAPGKDEGLIFS